MGCAPVVAGVEVPWSRVVAEGGGLSLTVVGTVVVLPFLLASQALVWWTFRGRVQAPRTCKGLGGEGGRAASAAACPRRVGVLLGVLAAGQGVLLVVQAELLVRAVAHLDAGPLPWLAGAVAGRAVLAWTVTLVAGRAAARAKRGLRTALLDGPAGDAGARVTLLTRGLDAVDPFFTGYVPQLLAACVVPPLVLARLFAADWASALVVAVTVPLVPVFGALVGMRTAALTGSSGGAAPAGRAFPGRAGGPGDAAGVRPDRASVAGGAGAGG